MKNKLTAIEKDWEKELRINLDEIFEDAQSYTGPNIDETFDRVFSFTKQFISNLLEEQRKEVIKEINFQEFEEMLNQMEISQDAIDDNNSMLIALIVNCRKLLSKLKQNE